MQMLALLSGETPLENGPLWMLCMYRFQDSAGRDACSERFDSLPVSSVGGKRVLRLFDNVCTVVNGGGLVPMWDACTIESYPSPSALGAVLAAAPFPMDSLLDLELHCFRGQWRGQEASTGAGATARFAKGGEPAPLPPGALEEAERLTAIKQKDKMKMAAISGTPGPFMAYMKDERFARDRVWQLNFLKMEDNLFYGMYGARASNVISSGATGGEGGPVFTTSSPMWTLRGVSYDMVATMQYPSRAAFVGFASSQNGNNQDSGAMAGGKERHALRTAGLAVQALISLSPDGVPGAFQDLDIPSNITKLASKL